MAQVTGFSLGSVLAEQPEFGGLSRIAQCGIPTQGLHLCYFNIFYRSYRLRGSLGDPERNFSSLINHDGWASGDLPQTPGQDTWLVKGYSYRRLHGLKTENLMERRVLAIQRPRPQKLGRPVCAGSRDAAEQGKGDAGWGQGGKDEASGCAQVLRMQGALGLYWRLQQLHLGL